MKQAVVNADDFGICVETNLGIELAFQRGILTSASLMPNMPGFEHAIDTVVKRNPNLGVGIHLVLTSGRSVADPARIPLLVDESGLFRRNFLGLLGLTSGPWAAQARAQIEFELAAQIRKVRDANVVLDHVNSHQHVHMIPTVWRTVVSLAERSGLPVVRLGNQLGHVNGSRFGRKRALTGNLLKELVLAACAAPTRRLPPTHAAAGVVVRHPDHFAAAMDRNGMKRGVLARKLAELPDGVTEIVTHPSLASTEAVAMLATHVSREDLMFLSSPARRWELDALIDPGVRATIADHGIALASFSALSRKAPALSVSHAH
jgi:predicted glycoside hydrolase/deacetylase ChbG (UPF0249 family)